MNNLPSFNRKYVWIIFTIILSCSALLIELNYLSIKVLSSICSYTNGESQYSKAQKDACRHLMDYILTSDEKSYNLYLSEIKVPVSDSIARVSLQKGGDYETAYKNFVLGRNHPEGIENSIWLFKNFQNMPYFKQCVELWASADLEIARLDSVAKVAHQYNQKGLRNTDKTALKNSIDTINNRLTEKQQAFSFLLGEAARAISKWLIVINIFFVLTILISAGLYARSMVKKLVESQQLIIAQNHAKDEFLSIASHELKTPLTSMKASLQIVERFARNVPESKQMHPFIINANRHANRLNSLVKDLLDVTKIQNGKLAINKTHFLLNELVSEVITEASQAYNHTYILGDMEAAEVNADPQKIYQVIDNLLSNAAKYSSEKHAIKVYVETSNGFVKVMVKDHGAGITESQLPHVFERFYRVEATKNNIQGLGLGLYICKEIIKSHNGCIGAESQVGAGSTFWFSLPLAS